MFGVSPPQKGLAQDSKDVDKKLLQQSDLKREFDQKLNAKLKDQQEKASSSKDSKPDQKPKLAHTDKDELKADRNQKKPSGGTKKKMVEPEELNETTISKVMASSESEVEIADPRKDLPQVETESSQDKNIKAMAGFNLANVADKHRIGLTEKVDPNAKVAATIAPQNAEAKAGLVASEELPQDDSLKSVLGQAALAQKTIQGDALAEKVAMAKNATAPAGKNLQANAVQITPEMIAAFRAAQAEAGNEKTKGTEDGNQAAILQKQLAQSTAQTAESGKAVDASSMMTKAVSEAAGAASGVQTLSTPVAGAVTGIGTGLSMSSGLQGEDEADAKNLQDVSATQNFEDMQNAQSLQDIPMMRMQQAEQQQQPEMTFEQQLGAEVGFEPEANGKQEVSKSALIQKMKEFEAEKGLSPEKANAFELKVLAMLRQERNVLANQSAQNRSGSEFLNKEKSDQQMGDNGQNLKSALGSPDAALHAGQTTQADFRNHMAVGAAERANVQLSPAQLAEHREENIQHIMNNAKFLVSKGGGEMVIKMSPDGMGPIALKVMMQDGKVNIQMQTQDKSVKKLIEDSLTELKSGLAAQRIHVDHVKIDTVNATNTENSAKFQSQQNSSDAQGRQQEFWKQFRENSNNQARKNSYADVQPVRQTAANPTAGKPAPVAARSGAKTGSTINRVA